MKKMFLILISMVLIGCSNTNVNVGDDGGIENSNDKNAGGANVEVNPDVNVNNEKSEASLDVKLNDDIAESLIAENESLKSENNSLTAENESLKNTNRALKKRNDDLEIANKLLEEQNRERESMPAIDINVIAQNELSSEDTVKIPIFQVTEIGMDGGVSLYPDKALVDNIGNIYTNGIGFYESGDIEYTTNKEYTYLTGNLVVSEAKKNSDFVASFYVYDPVTGKNLSNPVELKKRMDSIPIKIDISNSERIDIVFNCNEWSRSGCYVFFVNPCFEKQQ